MIRLPRLYAIADASLGNPVQLTRSLFEGGARLVQIRNKAGGAGELFDQVKQILSFAPPDATGINRSTVTHWDERNHSYAYNYMKELTQLFTVTGVIR